MDYRMFRTGGFKVRQPLLLLLCCAFFTACDGGSGHSLSEPESPSQPAAQNVLAFQADVMEALPVSLNVLDRKGGSTQVSEDTGGKSVEWSVSPDGKNAAYWYTLDSEHSILVLVELDSPSVAQLRLAIDGPLYNVSNFLQWLPDSRRVLYTTGAALWLAGLDDKEPVELFAAEPGAQASLSYSASTDGSRVAVVVNYSDTVNGSYRLLSAALFSLELGVAGEPTFIDRVEIEQTTLYAAWSPAENKLLYYAGHIYDFEPGAGGPLKLLLEDGSRYNLQDELSLKGARWLNSSRILVPMATGFEVIGTDGNQLTAHDSPFIGTGGETGLASIIISPDARWLAFLDWTSETELKTFLIDLDTAEERVVGPASSLPQAHHNVIAYYDESQLHWSRDSSWLAWNRQTVTPEQEYVYAHAVLTAETREVSRRAKFSDEQGHPWLPQGNVLEYLLRVTAGNLPQYVLVAEDLDADRTVFSEPYPFEPMTLADPESGQTVTITPYRLCQHFWLSNATLLWNGCDDNTYVSQLADGTLAETELITRSGANPVLMTNNREIVLMSPYNFERHWLMYDYPAKSLIELEETADHISSWRYTFLM